MNIKFKNEDINFLVDTILLLQNKEEAINFLQDLCTVPELKAMSQRLIVAKMLTENKVYSQIVNETSASTATISRVNRSLQYGNNGYVVLFDKMNTGNVNG